MLVALPSVAPVFPPPLPSGRILVFPHCAVVGSFILLRWRTNATSHLLLPIFHPYSVSLLTTTTHGQNLLSIYPWSGRHLGSMHLLSAVHPCGAHYLLLYVNLDPQRNFQERHIVTLTNSYDMFPHCF